MVVLLSNIDILIGQKIGNERHRLALYRLDWPLACACEQNVGVCYNFGWHRLATCSLVGSPFTLVTLIASSSVAVFDKGAVAVSRAEQLSSRRHRVIALALLIQIEVIYQADHVQIKRCNLLLGHLEFLDMPELLHLDLS